MYFHKSNIHLSVALCRFLSHSGSSGSKPRPPPQPRRYVPLTSHMDVIYSAEQIGFNLLDCLFSFQCFSRWRQQRGIDALWSGQLVRLENKRDTIWNGLVFSASRAFGKPTHGDCLLAALLLLLLWWQPQVGAIRFRIEVARNPTRP